MAGPYDRNVRLYPRYATAFNAFFWLPVFFLYFSASLPLHEVLELEAIYYGSVVVLEVPSGYLSDRVGRRLTLILSSIGLTAAYALFMVGSGFVAYAVAQALLAAAIAFASGTDTALHYDSLVAAGREEEYAQREALATRNAFASTAVAGLIGGALGALNLRLAWAASLVGGVATVALATRFAEPPRAPEEPVPAVLGQIRTCLGLLRTPQLGWLFGFAVSMVVLNHVPYEFYQPYLELLGPEIGIDVGSAPMSAGVHMALTMLIGSLVAAQSARIKAAIGLRWALMAAMIVQVALIGVAGLALHPVIAVLLLTRSAPRGLMTAPLNSAVTPRVPRAQRASYLSIQSLAGRLAFGGLLLALSLGSGAGDVSWGEIASALNRGLIVGLVLLALLAVTSAAVRDP